MHSHADGRKVEIEGGKDARLVEQSSLSMP